MYDGSHAENPLLKLLRNALSLIIFVVAALLISWGLRTFVVDAYEIPSGSMIDTIEEGDRVFAEKITYLTSEPKQGDIVTFPDPEIPSMTLIKRVIAVGGQTIDLVDGTVVIDGEVLDEPYTDGKPTYPLTNRYGENITYPYTVPEGCVWVMGDNRTNSQDSRYFGAVEADTIIGRGFFTYWPLDRVGLLS